jgi:hypothetical protein
VIFPFLCTVWSCSGWSLPSLIPPYFLWKPWFYWETSKSFFVTASSLSMVGRTQVKRHMNFVSKWWAPWGKDRPGCLMERFSGKNIKHKLISEEWISCRQKC